MQRKNRAQHVSKMLVSVMETRRGWEWVRQIWTYSLVGRASTDGSGGSIPKERQAAKSCRYAGPLHRNKARRKMQMSVSVGEGLARTGVVSKRVPDLYLTWPNKDVLRGDALAGKSRAGRHGISQRMQIFRLQYFDCSCTHFSFLRSQNSCRSTTLTCGLVVAVYTTQTCRSRALDD